MLGQGSKPRFSWQVLFPQSCTWFFSLLESPSSVEQGAAFHGFCSFWLWFGPHRPCLPRGLQMETMSVSSTGPHGYNACSWALFVLCTFVSVPGSPLLVGCGVPKGLGYSFCHCLQPQPLACQASQGQLLPWGRGDRLRSGPWQEGCWATAVAKSGCFQGTGSGSGADRPPLNVPSWFSALGGVTSGSWKRASGFSP